MNYQTILIERRDRVLLITRDRREARNALNRQLADELLAALSAAEKDREIGGVVLTGSEKAFAAGANTKEMVDRTYIEMYENDWFASWERFSAARKPLTTAVAGYALGGGGELAMMCDFIIATENAKFGQPEIKLRLIPGIRGSQHLARFVGKAEAMDHDGRWRSRESQLGLAYRPDRESTSVSPSCRRDYRRYVPRGDDDEGVGKPCL